MPSALSIKPPFEVYSDVDGDPLNAGYIYVGTAGLNPVTNPISVYFDAALTVPAAQPIRTIGGYPSNSGTPAMLYTASSDYSITIKNKNDSLIYTALNLTDRISAASVTYLPSGTGAIATTVQTVLREVVSVTRYGAVSDGDGAGAGTNNSAYIQAAHDAIVATGKAGVLHIPPGIYRCDTGINIDASVVRIEADGALLDFTNLTTGAAITVGGGTLGYAGNPFYNAYSVISGLKIQGNSSAGTVTGVRFYDSAQNSSAHSGMRDCSIWGFGTGVKIDENSYILSFDHVETFLCGTCVSEPTATNAGERIVFNNCAFYNSDRGFDLQNANASTFLNHCSIDGMAVVYFYITAGHLSVTDCHMEGSFSGTGYYPDARLFWNDDIASPSYSYVTFSGCHILVKVGGAGTLRANPVFGLDGAIFFTMIGGYVYANDGASVAAAVFGDDGTNSGAMKLLGTYVDNGSNPLFSMTGNIYKGALIALSNRDTMALGTEQPAVAGVGLAFPATQVPSTNANTLDDYEEGTFTPTVRGYTTVGTANYTRQLGYYTKIGNRVMISIDIIWDTATGTGDLGIAGLPFASNSASMLNMIQVIAQDVATTAGNYISGGLLGSSSTVIYIAQCPTGGGSLSYVPVDAAGQLTISGQYFVD